MQTPSVGKLVAIILTLVAGIAALAARGRIALPEPEKESFDAVKKKRKRLMTLGILSLWIFSGLVLGLFMREREPLAISISPVRVDLFGYSISSSVVVSWIVMAVLVLCAFIMRLFVIPKFQETPKGLQNVLELMVDEVSKFTRSRFDHENEKLASYFFAVAAMLIGSAIIELLGVRPPDTDLTLTLSYALITFVMINYYGIRKRGLLGRLKSFSEPNPVVTPFKVLSDIAIPISLACRLFGNMLGGLVVVDLIYLALGSFAVGIPAVLGLYFNAFHPLIQFFIFINLSLTFIGEAAEYNGV